VAEGARLESVYTGNRIEGSNPSLSASPLNYVVEWTRDFFTINVLSPQPTPQGREHLYHAPSAGRGASGSGFLEHPHPQLDRAPAPGAALNQGP
jgi:hypothetical protein